MSNPMASNKPITHHDREAVLAELLSTGLAWPPEYHGGLANHLPMTLHALYELGASAERLREFYASYTQCVLTDRLLPNSRSPASFPVNWLEYRGRPGTYPTLLAHFDALIAALGIEETLRNSLPALMPGVAAAAFHGLIRTAHAWQARHPAELATALGYWAWRWQPLMQPPSPAGSQLLPFEMWSQGLMEHSKEENLAISGGLIAERMGQACKTKTYLALAGALAPATSLEMRLAEFASFSIERYVFSRNFTVLHMVTGLHALRTVSPLLADSHEAQTAVAHCMTAAYIAAGLKPYAHSRNLKLKDWQGVTTVALQSNDAHTIKLVHACRNEVAVYAAGPYLEAASMAIS